MGKIQAIPAPRPCLVRTRWWAHTRSVVRPRAVSPARHPRGCFIPRWVRQSSRTRATAAKPAYGLQQPLCGAVRQSPTGVTPASPPGETSAEGEAAGTATHGGSHHPTP